MEKPKQTPLSYSLPSFKANDYDNIAATLQKLAGYGFRWVTFTPTYQVKERITTRTVVIPGTPVHRQPALLIWFKSLLGLIKPARRVTYRDLGYTLSLAPMPMATLRTAVFAAVQAGFHVKVEPHLDYAITLQASGEVEWRMGMRFNPDDATSMAPAYYRAVLKPIFDIIQAASVLPRPSTAEPACFALTLGSELDVSLFEYTAAWRQVLDNLQALRSAASLDNPFRLSFGHKVNYDTLTDMARDTFRINRARRRAGLPETVEANVKIGQGDVVQYLQRLDYSSLSFYAPLKPKLPSGNFDWKTPPTPADEAAIAAEFEKTAKGIRTVLGPGVPLDIGEFGLGNLHGAGPFDDSPEDFVEQDAAGGYRKNAAAHNARRKYIRALAIFLSRNKAEFAARTPHCSDYLPLTFWTVKQFDFLGVWDYPITLTDGHTYPHALATDDALREWVSGYNTMVYGP